jgi:hypothetical protein
MYLSPFPLQPDLVLKVGRDMQKQEAYIFKTDIFSNPSSLMKCLFSTMKLRAFDIQPLEQFASSNAAIRRPKVTLH